MILLGPEKKQAHILHASGSSVLWSCRTLQDPLCWLPASKSCNEKSDPSTSDKIQLKEEPRQQQRLLQVIIRVISVTPC